MMLPAMIQVKWFSFHVSWRLHFISTCDHTILVYCLHDEKLRFLFGYAVYVLVRYDDAIYFWQKGLSVMTAHKYDIVLLVVEDLSL